MAGAPLAFAQISALVALLAAVHVPPGDYMARAFTSPAASGSSA